MVVRIPINLPYLFRVGQAGKIIYAEGAERSDSAQPRQIRVRPEEAHDVNVDMGKLAPEASDFFGQFTREDMSPVEDCRTHHRDIRASCQGRSLTGCHSIGAFTASRASAGISSDEKLGRQINVPGNCVRVCGVQL